MTFANPLPAWAIAAVLIAAFAVAWLAYHRVPIARPRRYALSALRLITLIWIAICLMRPMVRVTDGERHDAAVAVLVDGSRSMGLADADGSRRRNDQARPVPNGRPLPPFSSRVPTHLPQFRGTRSAGGGRGPH